MDAAQAEQIANQWTEAWNNRDLDTMMDHCVEDIAFFSPFVRKLNHDESGIVRGKAALREYLGRGMEEFPHVRFQLHRTGVGIGSIVLNYISVNGMLANEVHLLNDEGKALEIHCHYSEAVENL